MSGASARYVESLAAFHLSAASPFAVFPQESRSGGSMSLAMIRAEQGRYAATEPASPDVMLSVVLRGNFSCKFDIGDGWTPDMRARSGDMVYLPHDTVCESEVYAPHELLHVIIPKPEVSKALDDHQIGPLSLLEALTSGTLFREEVVRRTMMQMWTESARSGGTSDLLMDGLTQVLLARLLDKAGALRRPQIVLPLSEAELTRLDEMIDARIANRLTVEDLAQTLDMPRWTFADAFKATTGDTPHAYVTGRRVERACELLRLADMPLAEIAYATGFASQSHMTDTFRRVLGTTPGKWRAEVRR